MFKRVVLTALILLTSSCFQASAQTRQFSQLLESFQAYQENNPAEKVFLHLDKTQYAQGETIWAKAYLVAGPNHQLSDISRNLHLELISDKGIRVKHIILETDKGLAHTDLRLGKELPEGEYYLRAYTNWMKNQGPDFFFNKKIKIHNLKGTGSVVASQVPKPMTLNFYPEGGQLVKNLASRLAFEVSGVQGAGQPLTGIIFNELDQPVTNFATSHEGRGMISFVPKMAGYYAILDGSTERYELPPIEEKGLVMLVNNRQPKELIVTVKTSEFEKQNLYLIAHTRGQISDARPLTFKGDRSITKFDKSLFPAGISHFTVLNQYQQPLAERLAFIQGDEGLNVALTTNKEDYATRELVTVGIKVTDAQGQPVQGSFSLSAFNQDIAESDQADYNINTHLLLSSDLKGHVKNPSQYFEGSKEASDELDLLMMVNGWRKFSWKQIKNPLNDWKYKPERGLTISGTLLREGKEKIKNGNLFLMNPNQTKQAMAYTDEGGLFRIENQHFYDTTKLVFQGFHKKGFKNVSLTLDSAFEQLPLTPFGNAPMLMNEQKLEAFRERVRSFVSVQEVWERRNGVTDLGVVTVESEREAIKKDARINPISNVLDFTDIDITERRRKDTYRILLGKVPGFNFAAQTSPDGNDDPMFLSPRMGFGERWRGAVPFIMIDGVAAEPIDVYAIDPTTIDYVVTSRVTPPGLISIYTMSAEKYQRVVPKEGMFIRQLPGYHVAAEFYSPKHDGNNKYKGLPDNRITLHWEPMITTDENGEAMLNFYTPDQDGNIVIDVQGLSFKGASGAGSAGFRIKSDL